MQEYFVYFKEKQRGIAQKDAISGMLTMFGYARNKKKGLLTGFVPGREGQGYACEQQTRYQNI